MSDPLQALWFDFCEKLDNTISPKPLLYPIWQGLAIPPGNDSYSLSLTCKPASWALPLLSRLKKILRGGKSREGHVSIQRHRSG
jgi:hypothetical protein